MTPDPTPDAARVPASGPGAVPETSSPAAAPKKLHGRAFYESIGSPKFVVAPMVDQSEFAWRMLSRSFLPPSERPHILAYSPMLHARLFVESQKYRDTHLQPMREGKGGPSPWLDGNPALDRPLFVQFCANDPDMLLAAARMVAPHCDAVDLNLGCPQGIARKGRYGAFLQEDQELVSRLVRALHEGLSVPVTAKIRVLETREATLAYARNVLRAGASILAVHGRRREQKGHLTGLADWDHVRYLRDHLPPDTVLFANGNVLRRRDLDRCLAATGADAVLTAEGHLSDPAIFAQPPPPVSPPSSDSAVDEREYWRGRDGRGGWRVDAIFRRYLDILHRHVLDKDPPTRRPLFVPGDDTAWLAAVQHRGEEDADGGNRGEDQPARKKRKRNGGSGNGDPAAPLAASAAQSPNMTAAQAHLFHLLRHLVSRHTDVRDALARARAGRIDALEAILDTVERRVAEGLLEYERTEGASESEGGDKGTDDRREAEAEKTEAGSAETEKIEAERKPDAFASDDGLDDTESSARAVQACRRPWWIAQPIIRPLPKEAIAKGAITLKKAKGEKAAANLGPKED